MIVKSIEENDELPCSVYMCKRLNAPYTLSLGSVAWPVLRVSELLISPTYSLSLAWSIASLFAQLVLAINYLELIAAIQMAFLPQR